MRTVRGYDVRRMLGVSLVVPTHQRVEAVSDTLPSLLAIEGIDEIVFVDDGSTDGTAEFLRGVSDSRIRVVVQPRRCGAPAARNRGVAQSSGEWVLFGEDDVRLPSDYLLILLEEAAANGARIVGAPFLLVLEGEDALPAALSAARTRAVESIALDEEGELPGVRPPNAVHLGSCTRASKRF